MSTIPALAKENGAEKTPLKNLQLPPPMSMGRSFGTPISNTSPVPKRSVTTSKKAQVQQSSAVVANKKIVRARKLVQQHRSQTNDESFWSSFASPTASTPSQDNANATYVVHFTAGPMGFHPEPTQGNFGCRVGSLAEGGPPGQALIHQVHEGDIILEINDEAVSHLSYDTIVDRLKTMAQMQRKILFRRRDPPTAPKPMRAFNLNSQGAFTPVVSPPPDPDDDFRKEKNSVSSVLFMDPSHIPAMGTPTMSVSDLRLVSTVPSLGASSPLYSLLPQDLEADVVLDINDDGERSQSIDTTSTMSPSKLKNITQEDLELGMEQVVRTGGQHPNASMVWVLRNVYNSVVGKKVGYVASKHIASLVRSQEQSFGDVSNTHLIGADDLSMEEKKEDAVLTNENKQISRDILLENRRQELNNLEWLEKQLNDAYARAEDLKRCLDSKQLELDQRLKEAQQEANSRVHEISKIQLAVQIDLEHKLNKSKTIAEQQAEACANLESELQKANTALNTLRAEKDESQAALEAIREQLVEIEANTDNQKSTQLEAQLQVAKLQTELREEKKEIERLKSDAANSKEQQHAAETRCQAAEEKLRQKQEELSGTKCMMETYEEKFMERESDFEAVSEEKEFAARELEFARSEIKRLHATLQERETEVENELQSLRQEINLSSKQLADQRQEGYDRERELQAHLTQRNEELQTAQLELAQMKLSASDASDRERSLMDALEKRDVDLDMLNRGIEARITTLNIGLREKEDSLEAAATKLAAANAEREKLMQQHQTQSHEQAQMLADLRAAVTKLDADLASKSAELEITKAAAGVAQQEKEILEQEAMDLKEAANAIYQEKSRVTKELQTAKFEISDVKHKATKTQDALLQRAKQMDAKAKDAQAQLKKKEEEELALQQKLERAQQKIETLSAELDQKEAALESVASATKVLQEKNDNLCRRELQLKADLDDKERERQGFQSELRDTKSTLFSSSSQISFLERRLSEVEAQKTIAEKEISGLRGEINSLNAKVDSQRESLEQKSWDLSTKSMEVMNVEATLENVREELKQKTEEVDAAQKSLASARTQYTQLNDCFVRAVDESSGKIQALTADLITAQDEVADGLKMRSKLDKQVVALKEQVRQAEKQSSEIRSQLVKETEKSGELSVAIESLKREWDANKAELLQELATRSALSKKLEEECQQRASDNANLAADMSSLEQKLSNARALFGSEQAKHKKDRADLEEAISLQKQEVIELSEKFNATTLELESVRKQLKDSGIRFEDQLLIMKNSTASKDSKLTKLLFEREETIKKLSNYQEELSLANLEIQRLEESRKQSRNQVESLTSLMESLQFDYEGQQECLIQKHIAETATLLKEKEQMESSVRILQEVKLTTQKRVQELERLVEEWREKYECLSFEQEALTASLHRAEDLAADLTCQLNLLEEKANDSVDSIDSQTLSLSKSELRMKCKDLAEEIQEAQIRAASAEATTAQKQMHVRRLEEDMAEMTAELGRMIGSSEKLETALVQARREKATCEADADELRTSIGVHTSKTKALKDELEKVYQENSELLDQVQDFQTKLTASRESEAKIVQDLEESMHALELLSHEHSEGQYEVSRIKEALSAEKERRESALVRVKTLESEISKLGDRLAATEEEKLLLHSESQSANERFEEQLRETNNESANLRSTISSFEVEIENQQKTIASLESIRAEDQEKLEKSRKYSLKMETLREEAVTKLAEASRVLQSQKGIITALEARAAQAEEKSLRLADEVAALKASIQKMEVATQENGTVSTSQLAELEKKRSDLEKARAIAKAEAETARDDLRAAQRKNSELSRKVSAQETRITDLKNAADVIKAQLREARGAWAESENLARTLENALAQSKAEADSLRARLTLSGATIARLRSDRALFQEAAPPADSKSELNAGDSSTMAKELSQLQAMLHTKASQLSTASNSLRNYKKMCSEMKSTEKSLVFFIEDIIVETKATFAELSRLCVALKELSQSQAATIQSSLKPLDLATPEKVFDDANCCLSNFVSLIKEASVSLEGKRRKLETWKAQSTLHTTTPNGKGIAPAAQLTPNESTAFRALRRMKEVVENHVATTSNNDSEKVQAVIGSLEGQIDALCSELKAANVALQAKDNLFTEQQAKIYALEQSKAAMKGHGNLSSIQEANEDEKEKLKLAAVRSVCKVLEIKTKSLAASGLRQWSNAAAAMHAADQQKHAAAALSKTLEMTREKLVMLKMSHRRSKGGSHE